MIMVDCVGEIGMRLAIYRVIGQGDRTQGTGYIQHGYRE